MIEGCKEMVLRLIRTKVKLKIATGIPGKGEKTVTVSGYWQKPLTVTALMVIKFH
jgi:hypothetical protein